MEKLGRSVRRSLAGIAILVACAAACFAAFVALAPSLEVGYFCDDVVSLLQTAASRRCRQPSPPPPPAFDPNPTLPPRLPFAHAHPLGLPAPDAGR